MTMASVLWPNNSATVRRSTPAITKRLANVWPRQCQVKSFTQAGWTAGSKHPRGVLAPPHTNSEPSFRAQLDECVKRGRVHRHVAHAAIFAARNGQLVAFEIYILPAHRILLASPHASVECQIEFGFALRANLRAQAGFLLFIQKAYSRVVLEAVADRARRIGLNLTVADTQSREQGAVSVEGGGRPVLLGEALLDV
jgi:hypothetical protein